jgi:hypothetical protein
MRWTHPHTHTQGAFQELNQIDGVKPYAKYALIVYIFVIVMQTGTRFAWKLSISSRNVSFSLSLSLSLPRSPSLCGMLCVAD